MRPPQKNNIILPFLLLFLFGPGTLFPEEGEEPWIDPLGVEKIMPLGIRVETSPRPQAPSDWTLTILADHPAPPELVIKPPPFPPSITLERVRVESRMIETRRWTATEFLFTLHEPGPLSLLPFEVIAPGKQGFTGELTLRVGAAPGAVSRPDPVFRWEERPPFLVRGTAAVLTLRLLYWEAGKTLPPQILRGRAPLNAILEERAPRNGPLYTFTLVPLDEQRVILGPWAVNYEGYTLTVPRLELSVRPSGEAPSGGRPGGAGGNGAGGKSPAADGGNVSGGNGPGEGAPERDGVFAPFRGEYLRILAGFREEWEAGRRAEGLGKLRTLERDSLLGPAVASLRRSAERETGLESTEDEKWKPWRAGVFIVILPFPFFAGALWLYAGPRLRNRNVPSEARKKLRESGVTLHFFKGFKGTFLLAAGILTLALLLAERLSLSGAGPAVLRETAAYRVPERGGTPSAYFIEGQPVVVHSPSGGWVYAEAHDGRSGWVPEDAVIPY